MVKPGQIVEVDKLTTDEKQLVINEVLLMVNGDKVMIGTPYLKDSLTFDVLETIKKPKVRVASFHAKANYRKLKGTRPQKTQLRLVGEKEVVKSAKKS